MTFVLVLGLVLFVFYQIIDRSLLFTKSDQRLDDMGDESSCILHRGLCLGDFLLEVSDTFVRHFPSHLCTLMEEAVANRDPGLFVDITTLSRCVRLRHHVFLLVLQQLCVGDAVVSAPGSAGVAGKIKKVNVEGCNFNNVGMLIENITELDEVGHLAGTYPEFIGISAQYFKSKYVTVPATQGFELQRR